MMGPGFAAHVGAEAIRRIGLTVLAIVIACGGFVLAVQWLSELIGMRDENTALQERLTEMQKSNAQLSALVKTLSREKEDCALLAKIDRGILIKQRGDCEAKLVTWTQDHCGDLCARSYEFAEYCKQIAMEMKQIAKEGRRAIERLETERESKSKRAEQAFLDMTGGKP
jgi:hypothetical protein